MKWLLSLPILVALSLTLTGVAQASPPHPLIYFKNNSTILKDEQITVVLPAFQTMVSRDLAPIWGTDATLTANPKDEKVADMAVEFDDWAECGCLGIHGIENGRPVSHVSLGLAQTLHDDAWLITAHELQEMIVDPWLNRFAAMQGRLWLVEVSDPVESGYYAYRIDGIPMSDFITPAWYGEALLTAPPGPFDFANRLKRPGQIGRHGYASWWDITLGDWKQVFG